MLQDKFNPEVLIAIPTFNLLEYLKKLLPTINLRTSHAIMLIDNGSTDGTANFVKGLGDIDGIFSVINDENLGCGAAWNQALYLGFEHLKVKKVLLLNNDTLLLSETLDRICADLEMGGVGLASAKNVSPSMASPEDFFKVKHLMNANYQETPDFSCFGINKECYDNVGFFDEAFHPAYFEDNDYHYRMKLASFKAICNYDNFYWHFGSRTKTVDQRFDDYLKWRYMFNRDYYKRKWGGEPGEEKYKEAFDGKSPEEVKIVPYAEYNDELLRL